MYVEGPVLGCLAGGVGYAAEFLGGHDVVVSTKFEKNIP